MSIYYMIDEVPSGNRIQLLNDYRELLISHVQSNLYDKEIVSCVHKNLTILSELNFIGEEYDCDIKTKKRIYDLGHRLNTILHTHVPPMDSMIRIIDFLTDFIQTVHDVNQVDDMSDLFDTMNL